MGRTGTVVAIAAALTLHACAVRQDDAFQRERRAQEQRRYRLQADVGERCILRPVDIDDRSPRIPASATIADLRTMMALLSAGDADGAQDMLDERRAALLPFDTEGTVIDAYGRRIRAQAPHYKLVRLSESGAELWVSSLHCRRAGT